MKFVNATNASRPRPGDNSHRPYDRKDPMKPAPPPSLPPPYNPNEHLKELLKVMKPEPKGLLESKLLRMSRTPTVDSIKKETEDILRVLASLNKK